MSPEDATIEAPKGFIKLQESQMSVRRSPGEMCGGKPADTRQGNAALAEPPSAAEILSQRECRPITLISSGSEMASESVAPQTDFT